MIVCQGVQLTLMQSIIIVSENINKKEEYLKCLCKKNSIDKFDVSLIESGKAIGVGDIKILHEKIYLKPFRGKLKAVILKIEQGISLEAQNALLKILEEPPEDTIVILSASSIDLLLPTIHSRCKIIRLDDKPQELSEKETYDFFNLLKSLLSSKIGARLKLAQDLAKNKEEVILWLEKIILALRKKVIKEKIQKQDLERLKSLQSTHKIISTTNVNPRFILENLFLNL